MEGLLPGALSGRRDARRAGSEALDSGYRRAATLAGQRRVLPRVPLRARVRKLFLRLWAASGTAVRRQVEGEGCGVLLDTLARHYQGMSRVALMRGATNDARRKWIARILDREGVTLGYAKWALRPLARKKLAHEIATLKRLPPGLGPSVRFHEETHEGLLAGFSAVFGRPPSVRLPVAGTRRWDAWLRRQAAFLDALPRCGTAPAEAHPRFRQLAGIGMALPAATARRRRNWPVVAEHGDFAPWNTLEHEGGLVAVDWEDAVQEGLPFIDCVYGVMQTAHLIEGWAPARTVGYARRVLGVYGLSGQDAADVIRCAAYDATAKGREAGLEATSRAQGFRWACIQNA